MDKGTHSKMIISARLSKLRLSSALHGHSTRSASSSSPSPPFAFARTGPFVQDAPQHENVFLGDSFLRRSLARILPDELCRSEVSPDLERFGARCSGELWRLGRQCEESPPFLRQTSAWGRRTDDVVTCAAWRRQKEVAAEEGIVALAYERQHGEFSRVHQLAKLFLYSPSSGLYSCPLAMTDGAAKTIEAGNLSVPDDAFARLTSRDPSAFWTSGQWMTEKGGGSDVANGTQTLAFKDSGGGYRLKGYKWFSSATDADMTLTLAR